MGEVLATPPYHVRDLRGTLWEEGSWEGEGWRGRSGGRAGPYPAPSPLSDAPVRRAPRRSSIKGLFILDGLVPRVGEGVGGGEK